MPFVASLMLRVNGVVSSPWLSMVLAGALSLAASVAGAWYWRRRPDGGPLLFSDLLVWGWLRRWRQERKLADAITALGLDHPDGAGSEQGLSAARAERVLSQLVDALERQDVYLRGHSRRVARHAGMIAQGMRLPAEEVDRVRAAAVVHDVGKLRAVWQVVNQPRPLSDAEFELVKLHPSVGAEMAAALADPGLTAMVRHHHERVDGTGYPDGLEGEQIPLGARIIAVADTFDAVTSTRPYRGAARHQQAIEILREASGSQLDPAAVRAFLAYYSGHRLALAWGTACAMPRRIIGWFNGEALAAPVSSGKLAAAVAMSAAVASGVAVAPIADVNPSGLLRAAPAVSTTAGNSTETARAQLGTRRSDGKQRESSSPARGRETAPVSANTAAAPRHAGPIGEPAAHQLIDPVGNSPAAGPGTASTLSASTLLAAPPTPTPASTAAPTTSQPSSTVSAPTTQAPATTAPATHPSHRRPAGHAGPRATDPSASANGKAGARPPSDPGPTSPSGGSPGNAYGQANGQPGNPNPQGDPGEQGNPSDPSDASGQATGSGQANATGPAKPPGHANGAPQESAGAQGKAYGRTQPGY
jgi:hypothetical protein